MEVGPSKEKLLLSRYQCWTQWLLRTLSGRTRMLPSTWRFKPWQSWKRRMQETTCFLEARRGVVRSVGCSQFWTIDERESSNKEELRLHLAFLTLASGQIVRSGWNHSRACFRMLLKSLVNRYSFFLLWSNSWFWVTGFHHMSLRKRNLPTAALDLDAVFCKKR